MNKGDFLSIGLEPITSDEVILLAPLPKFWRDFENSREYSDSKSDPMDRYSKRVIQNLANALGVQAVFPSDGPPYPPFISWAFAAEGVYSSPIGLLVHDRFGLSLSFRGALKIAKRPKRSSHNPCKTCHRPCATACPVEAFKSGSYNVSACREYLRSGDVDCWHGCLARRVCPETRIPQEIAHSEFSMRAFCPDQTS